MHNIFMIPIDPGVSQVRKLGIFVGELKHFARYLSTLVGVRHGISRFPLKWPYTSDFARIGVQGRLGPQSLAIPSQGRYFI